MEPLVILGATATGKSALALHLAEELGGEIVNADALQVYRGFDIGTGKPTAAERRRVPHHLLDILDPDQPLSAGEFARRARATVAEVQARGRLPLVVGGSGLYLRALLAGISAMPAIDPRLRAWLAAARRRQGLPALRRWLDVLDPGAALRTRPADSQRTLRALELALGSGRPQGWWTARQPFAPGAFTARRVGLTLPRDLLYDRIAGRVSAMVAAGWVGEVENLLHAGWDPGLPAFQAIGYRQLAQHVRGRIALDQAVEETIRATRRYAKRQSTWFRREPDVAWFQADDAGAASIRVLHFLQNSGGRLHGQACDQHPGRFPLPEPQGGA
ncbi:MAG TPA: tRNA (adenosine(37)-N6)-dimethylallyltransferase MiaA [Thermoanaerobaculia bacterium]|jgi:tRNA dimethylallyltransferase|nr:tRNA (adenosine(37)-N6)-dimethylallyltransferase MiaA [Thermoanaerobaculia bacterium]